MKILFVTTGLPYPPDSGVRIPTYNFIRELSKRNEVYLFSLIHSEKEKNFIKNLKPICRQIYISELKLPGVAEKIRIKDIFGIFSKLPLSIERRESKPAKQELLKVIKENKFDVIQIEQTAMTEYGKLVTNIPTVLATRDIVSQMIKRQSLNEKNLIKRKIIYYEYRKMLNYEKRVQGNFKKILAVSQKDKDFFTANSISNEKIAVVPNGVDINRFCPTEMTSDNTLLYTGDMNYFPNFDAVQYFYQKILPIILNQKMMKFLIVGNAAKMRRNIRNDKNLELIGHVEDTRPYFRQATIVVVPLRVGCGTRFKILEGMAMGRPVVSTSIGCEGLEVTDGENILIADKPKDFAHSVIKLLDDKSLWNKLAQNGRKLVEEKYSR